MSLTYAIFAALSDKSQSGYDLFKLLTGDSSCCWQVTQQQIYRELGKLEVQGLIVPNVVPQKGRPDKKVYSMTLKAQALLQEWFSCPSRPTRIREGLLVKILVAHLGDSQIILDELKHRQDLHQEKRDTYQATWENAGCSTLLELPMSEQCRCMALRRGIVYEQSWVSWCEETIAWLCTCHDISDLDGLIDE